MISLRLPNITAATEQGQLEQIRSYLYQFAQEINWAMSTMEGTVNTAVTQVKSAAPKNKNPAEKAQATFSEIKSLIIKSADIVNAYYDEINSRLEGLYVAQSDFGTYMQETSLDINGTPTSISLMFENQQSINTNVTDLSNSVDAVATDVSALDGSLQTLQGQVDGVLRTDEKGTTILGAQAWCKIGVLEYEESGFPVYGMEIGQENEENGTTVSKKFARYCSDGVRLYDQNGTEVATITGGHLRITNAEINNVNITGSLKLGGYTISTDNGLAVRWAGGNT